MELLLLLDDLVGNQQHFVSLEICRRCAEIIQRLCQQCSCLIIWHTFVGTLKFGF